MFSFRNATELLSYIDPAKYQANEYDFMSIPWLDSIQFEIQGWVRKAI